MLSLLLGTPSDPPKDERVLASALAKITECSAAPPASAALAAAAAACIRAASPAAPERLRRDLDGYPRKRKAAGQPSSQ